MNDNLQCLNSLWRKYSRLHSISFKALIIWLLRASIFLFCPEFNTDETGARAPSSVSLFQQNSDSFQSSSIQIGYYTKKHRIIINVI